MMSWLVAESEGVTTPQLLLLAGVVMLILVFINMGRRRRATGRSQAPARRQPDARRQETEAIRRDLESLIVELEELSRQINAQIDTKFAKLEKSIHDADKRISALRILIDASKSGASDVAAGSGPTGESAAHGSADPAETDARTQRILALAGEGASARQIADQLGEREGEVELILNLHARSRDDAGPTEST